MTTNVKPTFEALFSMSNAQLSELSDTELDAYFADALTISKAAPVQQVQGKTVISTQMRGKSSSHARTPKHKGPSQLRAELLAQAQEAEIDAEFQEIIAAAAAERASKPRRRI